MSKKSLGLLLFFLSAAMAVGIFFVSRQNSTQVSSVSGGKQKPSNEWLTYKNEKWGYSLMYPGDVFMYCDTHNTPNVASFLLKDIYKECPNELTMDTVIHLNLIVMDEYEHPIQDEKVVRVDRLLIEDRLGAISYFEIPEDQVVNGIKTYYLAELPMDGKKLSIAWLLPDFESFDQILSTLQFED